MSDCPQCPIKDHTISDLQKENGALSGQVKALEGDLTRTRAEAAKPREYPTLRELVGHCRDGSCNAHARELADLREEMVKGLTRQEVESLALEKDIIPTKITVRG